MSRPFFFALLLVFVSGASFAADNWVIHPDGSATVNRYTRFPAGYFPTVDKPMRDVFGQTVTAVPNQAGPGVRVSASRALAPIGSGSPLATVETALLSRAAIKAAGRALARVSPYAFIGLEVMDYLNDDDITLEGGQFVKPGETSLKPIPGATKVVTPSGVPGTFNDPEAACQAATEPSWPNHDAQLVGVSFYAETVTGSPPATTYRFGCNIYYPGYGTFQNAYVDVVQPVCPDGTAPINGQCIIATKRPATDSELEAAIDAAYDDTSSPQVPMVNAAIAAGVPFSLSGDEPSTTTLKQGDTVTGTETTTTSSTVQNDDGTTSIVTSKTTTTHTTRVDSISGDGTLAGTQVNVTVTSSNPASSSSTTTTSTNTSTTINGPDGSTTTEDVTFTDPSMPAVPDLYQQKYPQGITGVWAEHWPRLQATAFMTGLASMFPTFGDSGTCPQWGMSLDIGEHMMFGYGDLTVACSLWQIIGLIILTTACFTAWRIIF